jgi:hypothetical protein
MLEYLFNLTDNKQNILDQDMFFLESSFACICGHSVEKSTDSDLPKPAPQSHLWYEFALDMSLSTLTAYAPDMGERYEVEAITEHCPHL